MASHKLWAELSADEQAAGRVLGFTEPLWSAAIRTQETAALNIRTWLNGLKMSELMGVARESGVPPEQVDDALDQEAPKSVIVGLMEQVGCPFMSEWVDLTDAEAGAAQVLGLGAECFEARVAPPVDGAVVAAPKAEGGPDEDELVLLEPAVFNDGERPSCPKCGIPCAPLQGGPVQRAQFTCCDVEATPYEVAVADARRLYAAGEYDEAESTFDEAAMLGLDEAVPEEERATCYLYRGLCLVELDDELDEAMECFANACEIVALGPRKTATGEPVPAPAPAPVLTSDSIAVASTSAVASYIHGLLLRSEGRDESKAKALIDAAIQMAASVAIEDIASNVEEVTRSVGTKDYGKKHTYEQAYSRALQLRCFWEYCGAASLSAALMNYGQYSYAADACTMALGQMHAAKEGVILEIDLGMPQLLSHREEQRRHRITVACYRARAQCMFHMSAWPQALDDFKETSRRVSSDPFVMYHMGLCHVKLGQWKDAKDALQKSLRLDPRGTTVSVSEVEVSMRLVSQELKKQELAAMQAERELLASLEEEGDKKKKPSKKQKKKQRDAEKLRKEAAAATKIASVHRGRKGREEAAVLRTQRAQDMDQARKNAHAERVENEKERKRKIAEGRAEAIGIEKAIALARTRAQSGDEDDLDDYLCPLTLTMFVDPVTDSLGHTYERKAIEHWLETHTTSPKTNQELKNKILKPDMVMRAAIDTINAIQNGGGGGYGGVGSASAAASVTAALGGAAMGVPSARQEDDDEEVLECPLCCESFDETDKCFKPCPCNYKVCLYCFHHIKDQGDKKCPACRAEYGDGEMVEPKKPDKKKAETAAAKAAAAAAAAAASSGAGGGTGGGGGSPQQSIHAQRVQQQQAQAKAQQQQQLQQQQMKAQEDSQPGPEEIAESDMMLDPRTYRTKLCKRWQDGHCSYGASCWFAHGKEQLRLYNPNPSAKAAGAPPVGNGAQQSQQQQPSWAGAQQASSMGFPELTQNERGLPNQEWPGVGGSAAPAAGTWGNAAPGAKPAGGLPAGAGAPGGPGARPKPCPFDIMTACDYCANFRIESVEDPSRPISKPNKDGTCPGKYANLKFHVGKKWKQCVVVRAKGNNTKWERTRPRPANYTGKLCINESGNTWSGKKNSQSRIKLQPVLGCANDKRCRYAHGGFEKRLWETMCPFGSRKFCEYGELCPMNHSDNSEPPLPGDGASQDGQFGEDAELELLQEGFEQPPWEPEPAPAGGPAPIGGSGGQGFGGLGSGGMGILGAIGGGDSGIGSLGSDDLSSGLGGLGGAIGGLGGGGLGGFGTSSAADDNWGGGLGGIGGGLGAGLGALDFGGGGEGFNDADFFGSNFASSGFPSELGLGGSQTSNVVDLDQAGAGWSSMLSSLEGSPARNTAPPEEPSVESVDYMYAANPAVRRGGMGIGLRFDGQGNFARVTRSAGMTDKAVPAGMWSIQRRQGDNGGITVILTLKWIDRDPEAMVSSDGGIAFSSQAKGDQGPSLTLRSSTVPSWFMPSPQKLPGQRRGLLPDPSPAPQSSGFGGFPEASSFAQQQEAEAKAIAAQEAARRAKAEQEQRMRAQQQKVAQQQQAQQQRAEAARQEQLQRQEAARQQQLTRQQEMARQKQAAQQLQLQQQQEAQARRLQAAQAQQAVAQQRQQQKLAVEQAKEQQKALQKAQSKAPDAKESQPQIMGDTGMSAKEHADAHKGQQWHKYLGWVDAKYTPKQLLKEEKKAKREAEKKRKKEGVTELQGFQPVFYKDLSKTEAAGDALAAELEEEERKKDDADAAAAAVARKKQDEEDATAAAKAASNPVAQGNGSSSGNSPIRKFLSSLGLEQLYGAVLEQQEFTDVELFAQCSDADFSELNVAPAHAKKIREALPSFLEAAGQPRGNPQRNGGSGFQPDPRVRQLLEIANVDVDKYFALFCEAEIDGGALALMSAADMKDVGVAALGPRRKILHAISTLHGTPQQS